MVTRSADALGVGSASTPAPVDPAERIEALDVLRGLALFGVLAINLDTEFRVSIFEQFLPSSSTPSMLDRAVEMFLMQAVYFKAISLFSLLFGAGLAIQFDRLQGNPGRTILLMRRLVVLLAIGLAHLFLIWNGDILTHYAVAGLVVLPFLFGPRWLLGLGASFFAALYIVMPALPLPISFPDPNWMMQHVAEARRVYGNGGFSEILSFRIDEVRSILPFFVYLFPLTVTLFLVGVLIWRSEILRRASPTRLLLFGGLDVGLIAGAGLIIALTGSALFRWPLIRIGFVLVTPLVPDLLALGYGAIVIGVMRLPRGRRMLAWAAPIGRMAFTNYLAQSVILGWIFYGYGLGLFGRLGVSSALLIGITLYAAQVWFSTFWLRRYRYGPVEWLWRTLMYGVPQPMRLTGVTTG